MHPAHRLSDTQEFSQSPSPFAVQLRADKFAGRYSLAADCGCAVRESAWSRRKSAGGNRRPGADRHLPSVPALKKVDFAIEIAGFGKYSSTEGRLCQIRKLGSTTEVQFLGKGSTCRRWQVSMTRIMHD